MYNFFSPIFISDREKIIGAVWVRIMNDYGHIDNTTPSLAMSVFKEYRGLGVGTALLEELIAILKSKGYARISVFCKHFFLKNAD